MTRLFLASSFVVAGVIQLAGGWDLQVPIVRPESAFDMFGIEGLDRDAANAQGLLSLEGAQTSRLVAWESDLRGARPYRPARKLWVRPMGSEESDYPASLNLELVRRGLALGHLAPGEDAGDGRAEAFAKAAEEAQHNKQGMWAKRDLGFNGRRAVPFGTPEDAGGATDTIAGVALPMHHKEEHQTYAWELTEIVELGAEWVNLIVATRVDKVDSIRVPLTSARTPSDGRIRATIELAHSLGLRVQLMPIVLIENPGPKDWRGRLAPTDPGQYWRSYDRFICHMADLASKASAEVFCVGSEFASLEGYQAEWTRVIANVRMRYRGQLTYSANWDHYAEIPFWSQLDFASMTGYFTLCEEAQKSASEEDYACVVEGWKEGLFHAWRLARISGLPTVFSEIGVPSVTGALAGPWDYTLDTAVDVEAQRLAFEAFREVLLPGGEPAEGFSGAFLYDFWGPGGAQDKTYTARGKPALEEWRKILAALRN
jgi:hypothetical protein